MSVRTKILLFMGSLVAVYIVLLFAFSSFFQRQVDAVLAERKEQRTNDLTTMLDLFSAQQKAIIDDYTLWDESVDFIRGKRDAEWARSNYDMTLSYFKFDALWMFDLNGKLLWEADSMGGDPVIRKIALPTEGFAQLYASRYMRYFIDTPYGVMDVYARTVHGTKDDFRKEPRGFMIIGSLLSGERLDNISSVLLGTVAVATSTATVTGGPTDVVVSKELDNWNGERVATLSGVIPLSLASQLQAALRQFIIISIAFGLFTLGIVFLLLFYLVSRPLKMLTNGFAHHDDALLAEFSKHDSEFGVFARAVQLFFAEQKEKEEVRARSDALLGSIGDGVIGIDKEWVITTMNRAAERIIGVSPGDAIGKSFRDVVKIFRTRDRGEHLVYIEEALIYGKTISTEEDLFIVNASGAEIPTTSSAAPIVDESKRVLGAVVVLHDATREMQTRLIRSDFAYASHQLRTPVTETMWAINSALEERNPDEKNSDLRMAEHSIQSVHKLVEHLLDVSEIEQHSVMPHCTSVNVRKIIDEVIANSKLIADKRDVRFRVSVEDQKMELMTDEKLLYRVLREIVENAILYGEAKGTVNINVEKQNDGVRFAIKNSGKPIHDTELPLVFTKFFRGSSTSQIPGAGLGLFIAREYLKLLGARVWFTSEYPDGTTFNILHPIEKS